MPKRAKGLTIAVTGPTGDIGKPLIRALERGRDVERIVAMARSPFDPADEGWTKTEYRQGDVLDRAAVDELVDGADVVIHLAFVIMSGSEESRRVNLEGSRNVFEAAVAAGCKRLIYTSSVAAYGFHDDNPSPLTEDVEPRGTEAHSYSAQKAEVEALLAAVTARAKKPAVYVFRPCIVAGPDALLLIENIPYVQLGERMPDAVRRLIDAVPLLKPVIPDNGTTFQLVHHDDVASALRAAALGRGEPGIYNLAGAGTLTLRDLADALGWYTVPVPELAVDATAEAVARMPFLPPQAQWINVFRVPVIVSTRKARRELGWRPRHESHSTLTDTIAQARREELLR
jgi:UDP-glucose 4-epimerase